MIRFHSLIVPLLSSSFLAVFVFSSCLFGVDGLPDQWLQDFEKADEVAAKEKKPIFAVFSTSWCGPCREMIKSVYPHKDVIAELNNWVPVYVDGDEYRDLAKSHNIIGFPTHILFNTNGVEAARFVGGAADATEFLKRIANAKDFSLKFPPLKAKVAAAPTNTFLLKEMGDLLAKSERMEDAYKVYSLAMQFDPKNAAGIPEKIVSYISKRGGYEVELLRLNASIQNNPQNAAAFNERGRLKYANRDWTAGEDFARALEIDMSQTNGVPPAMLERLLSKVMFDKESGILDTLIEKSPNTVSLRLQRADLLSGSMDTMYNQDNIAKALADYSLAVEIDKNSALTAKGHIAFLKIFRKMQARDAKETIQELDAFEKQYPHSPRIPVSTYLRAMALIQSENAEKGVEILEQLVKDYPDHELGQHVPRMLKYIKQQIAAARSGAATQPPRQ
jgi:tetratricopeptide (TPR) repeat protein